MTRPHKMTAEEVQREYEDLTLFQKEKLLQLKYRILRGYTMLRITAIYTTSPRWRYDIYDPAVGQFFSGNRHIIVQVSSGEELHYRWRKDRGVWEKS
jgi:hypothetical protein